jgi:phosphopantetheinyl transferase
MKKDTHGVSGAYSHPPCGWDRIIEYALTRPHLAHLARNFQTTKHPACLNAIVANADAGFWLVWYGKEAWK